MKCKYIAGILSILLCLSFQNLEAQTLEKVDYYPFDNGSYLVEDHLDKKAYFFLAQSTLADEDETEFILEELYNSEGSFILRANQDTVLLNDLKDPSSRLITTAVSVGDTGWIVGGEFTSWTDQNLKYIARLDTLGNAYNTAIELNGPVSKLWLLNDTLYMSGPFTSVNGKPRQGFAAVTLENNDVVERYLYLDHSVENVQDLGSYIAISRRFQNKSKTNRYEGLIYNKFSGVKKSVDLPVSILEEGQSIYDDGFDVYNIAKSVSDGNGGFFIAGKFSQYGDSARENVVHLNAQGRVSDWRCDVYPGPVNDIELSNDTLYIAGIISSVRGENRYGYAAVDLTTNLLTPLTYTDTTSFPLTFERMEESLHALDIEVSSNSVLVKGYFNRNYNTHNIYSLSDSLDTELISSRNYPFEINGGVSGPLESHVSMPSTDGGWFYYGNEGLVKLNSIGDKIPFSVPSVQWRRAVFDDTTPMDLYGGRVYLGNTKQHMYDWPFDYQDIVSFDAETGELLPFFISDEFTSRADINEIECHGDTVFIASDFISNQEDEPVFFSAYKGSTSENFPISVTPQGDVYGLEIVNEAIYVFGDFDYLTNGDPAHNIVKYNLSTLEIIDFDLNIPGEVITDLVSDGENIILASEGTLRAFSIDDEVLSDWSVTIDNLIEIKLFNDFILATGDHQTESEEYFRGIAAYSIGSTLPEKLLFESVNNWFAGTVTSGNWKYPRYSIQGNRFFVAFGIRTLDQKDFEEFLLLDKEGNSLENSFTEAIPDASELNARAIPNGFLISKGGIEEPYLKQISDSGEISALNIDGFSFFDDLTVYNDSIYFIQRQNALARFGAVSPDLSAVAYEHSFDIGGFNRDLELDIDEQNFYVSGRLRLEVVNTDFQFIYKNQIIGFDRFSEDSLTHLPSYNSFIYSYMPGLGMSVSDSLIFVEGPLMQVDDELLVIDKSSDTIQINTEFKVANMIAFDEDLIVVTIEDSPTSNAHIFRLDPLSNDTLWYHILDYKQNYFYDMAISGDSLILSGIFDIWNGESYDEPFYIRSFNLISGEESKFNTESLSEPWGLPDAIAVVDELLFTNINYNLGKLNVWDLPSEVESNYWPYLWGDIRLEGLVSSGSNLLALSQTSSSVSFPRTGSNLFIYDVNENLWETPDSELPHRDLIGGRIVLNSDSIYYHAWETGLITAYGKQSLTEGGVIELQPETAIQNIYITDDYLYLSAFDSLTVFGEQRGYFAQIDLDNYSLTDFNPEPNTGPGYGAKLIHVVDDSIMYVNAWSGGPLKILINTNEVSQILPGYSGLRRDMALGDSLIVISQVYQDLSSVDVNQPIIKNFHAFNAWTNEEADLSDLDFISNSFHLHDSLLFMRHQIHADFGIANAEKIYSLYDLKNSRFIVNSHSYHQGEIGFIDKTVFFNDHYAKFNLCPSSVSCIDTTVYLSANDGAQLSANDLVSEYTTECQGGIDPGFELSQSSFSCSDQGPNTVTLYMTSEGSLATCQSVVIVLDTISPMIACTDTLEVSVSVICPEDIITSIQNECLTPELSINGEDALELECDQWQNMVEVELSATDISGNTAICNSVLNVVEITEDLDGDGIDDTCDICVGDNSSGDSDSDGICDDSEVAGCQDPAADNYNPDATDPAPCEYSVEYDGPIGGIPGEEPEFTGRPAPDFEVYPNPLRDGDLSVFFDQTSSGGQLIVYDLLGKAIAKKSLQEGQQSLNLPVSLFLAEGVYLLSFIQSNGAVSYRRVMVVK